MYLFLLTFIVLFAVLSGYYDTRLWVIIVSMVLFIAITLFVFLVPHEEERVFIGEVEAIEVSTGEWYSDEGAGIGYWINSDEGMKKIVLPHENTTIQKSDAVNKAIVEEYRIEYKSNFIKLMYAGIKDKYKGSRENKEEYVMKVPVD